MEGIVRHRHGHQEIITHHRTSVVELRFYTKNSLPLEQLKIKAWRGETKLGLLLEVDQRLTARRTPRFAVSSDFVRRHLSWMTAWFVDTRT